MIVLKTTFSIVRYYSVDDKYNRSVDFSDNFLDTSSCIKIKRKHNLISMYRHNQAIYLQCNMLMNFSFTFHLLIDGYWNPHFHHIEDLTRTASCLTVSQSIPYMTRVPYTIHDGMRYLSLVCINLHCNNHSPNSHLCSVDGKPQGMDYCLLCTCKKTI